MSKKTYLRPQDIRSVAVLGIGSVGASWAALFLAHGMSVVAHDLSTGAEALARSFINDAWPALVELGIARTAVPDLNRLRFVDSAAEAARAADLVQENVPEKAELKARVLQRSVANSSFVDVSEWVSTPSQGLQSPSRKVHALRTDLALLRLRQVGSREGRRQARGFPPPQPASLCRREGGILL